ncbi:hypothetical protein GCM10027031_11840 [Corynebacterium atrinae]
MGVEVLTNPTLFSLCVSWGDRRNATELEPLGRQRVTDRPHIPRQGELRVGVAGLLRDERDRDTLGEALEDCVVPKLVV